MAATCPPLEREVAPDEEGLIETIARETVRRLVASPAGVSIAGTGVDREDLLMEARIAGLLALRRYDPARGTSLTTWMVANVRGAVYEGLRVADILTRAERTRYKEACRSGVDIPPPRTLLSLSDFLVEQWDAEIGERQTRRLPTTPDPDIEATPDRAALAAAFDALPGRVSPAAILVANWHLKDEVTLKECASRLKLSESRAHQLLKEARAVLQPALLGSRLPRPKSARRQRLAWVDPFLSAVSRGVAKRIACDLSGISSGLPGVTALRRPVFAAAWNEARKEGGRPLHGLRGRPWAEPFLALVRLGQTRSAACAAVGVGYSAPNQAGNRDPDFRRRWREARVAAGACAPADWTERYLEARAAGLSVVVASAKAGVHHNTPASRAARDPLFRAADERAREAARMRRAA